jgi:hypothetical protein
MEDSDLTDALEVAAELNAEYQQYEVELSFLPRPHKPRGNAILSGNIFERF